MKDTGKTYVNIFRQGIALQQGIPQEKAKEMVKLIKDLKLKVNAEIQKDQVRVRAKKNRRSPDHYGQTEGKRLRDTSYLPGMDVICYHLVRGRTICTEGIFISVLHKKRK